MTKKEIMKHYKKGTEVKLVSTSSEQPEMRGHVVGYWQMMDKNWGVEVLSVGHEQAIQVATEDVIRVFKDKNEEEAGQEKTAPAQTESRDTTTETETVDVEKPTVIELNPGDVVDEETGEVIRRALPGENEPHPMEKAPAAKVELDPELVEEMNKLESVAAKIRFLLGKGVGRSQVAKALGVGYRYVYAIEHKPLKRELPLVIIPHHNKAKS